MNRLNFTTERLAKLTCPEGTDRVYYHDEKTLGLVLCVTTAGAKTFYVYRRLNGKPTRVRLGVWPGEFSVDAARKKAATVNGAIAQGIDPRQAQRAARAERTFAELFQEYIDKHVQPKRKATTCKEYQRQFHHYLKPWHGKRLSEIDGETVQALHARLGQKNGPYVANRVLALISAVFRFCRRANPTTGIAKFTEQSRERFLQADELPRFFAAIEAEPDEAFRDFFLLALFTGARRGNVQSMLWESLNLYRGEWKITDNKSGKPITVHLSPEAVEILARRQANRNGSPYVFPGRGRSGHLEEPKLAWQRLLNRAGITDLRLHDLRRTLGSWQAATGASLPVIGKSLGHRPGSPVTAVYARLNLDPVRESVNTATAAMLAAAAGTQKGRKTS